MQLTILADKLPHLSTEQFIHEFRVVHADETTRMARSLGIVSQYIQGLILPSIGQEKLRYQPLPESEVSLQSFAQLSWAALEILQGSFSTQGYRESAGKHIFAEPRKIFLTERLESDIQQIKEGNPVRIVMVLAPKDSSDTEFGKSWDSHATLCRRICTRYQRNQIIQLGSERITKIFTGTQFPADAVVRSGGYEEFLFESNAEAQTFFEKHNEELKSSYNQFVAKSSFCTAFDAVVQHDENDRSYQQIFTGTFIGMVLRAKVYFEG